MSHIKDLENITESERVGLRDLLLDRISELNEKKKHCTNVKKLNQIQEMVDFNTYLFHWLDEAPTNLLQ
jgi:hypothetical protein